MNHVLVDLIFSLYHVYNFIIYSKAIHNLHQNQNMKER